MDLESKEYVAIKVIKNRIAFTRQGIIEVKILDIINRTQQQNQHIVGDSPLVKMKDYFVFRNHLVIVFELLSVSLYDVLV